MMFEKVQKALLVYGMILPGPVKAIIQEMASELDRLRADVEALRSKQ